MLGTATHTLLVADPDHAAARLLEQALGAEGIHVEHRVDSRAFLRSLESEEIDAVFLAEALALAEPDLISSVTLRFPDVPLVVMLPGGARADLGRWVSAGAADFVR